MLALFLGGLATAGFRLVRQPEAGQRHACEADAEFLQRPAPRNRLGQVFGEFIELVVHTFPFDFVFFLFCISGCHCLHRRLTQLNELAGIAIAIAAYRLFDVLAVGIRATEADGAEPIVVANSAAALAVARTGLTWLEASRFRRPVSPCPVRQPEGRQCHAGEAEAEFPQRRAAGHGLSHALGEFIELVVHVFPFVLVV